MKFAKGSPEAKAYMASIRGGHPARPERPHVRVIDEEGGYDVDLDEAVRGRIGRPGVRARAVGDDFSAMTVRDERGNTASAVSMSKEMIERQFMMLELKAEKRRQKKEEEREDLIKKAVIGGGIALAAWFLFVKPKTPPTPPKA